ncbi:MAG TPA: hypothetical protein PK636_01865 [bacterium]|nr:hypothetical protein [bacterium]HPJ71412.1 hypothetical protein [bacterium]HPQ65917.1 hypothetical protein [bacterium]
MNEYLQKLSEVVARDPRYRIDAYLFVNGALGFLIEELGERRHVTGQELLEGIRRYALESYGPLSREVLNHWGVSRCADFGEIVFNLVENDLMGKTDKDSREDFHPGYDFYQAFEEPFLKPGPAGAS